MSTPKDQINHLHNSDLYLYFYADALSGERTERECDYIDAYCKISGPQQILDLACGHGRHANAMARRGHQVWGIDMNPSFIEIAR